jgi:hypothetical protein
MVSFRLFPSLKVLSALAPLDSSGDTVHFAGCVYLLALQTLWDFTDDQDRDGSYRYSIASDSSRHLWCCW